MKSCDKLIPVRYTVYFLGFWGTFFLFALRVILGISLVAMTGNRKKGNESSEYPLPSETRAEYVSTINDSQPVPKFDWDQNDQGLIVSAYFYGFLATQLLGAILSTKTSPKWVSGIGLLIAGILSLVSPVCASYNFNMFFVIRVLLGIVSGLVLVPLYLLAGLWSPLTERGMSIGILYLGTSAGSVVSQIGSGYLIKIFDANGNGWKYPFYVFGSLTCVWFVLWSLFTSDFKRNSEDNQKFIEEASQVEPKTGLYSSLPFIAKVIFGIAAGVLSTWMQIKFKLSTNFLRKLFTSIAYYGAGAFVFSLGFIGCSDSWNISLLCLAMGIFGLQAVGINCTFVDMAPRFTAITFGISNTISNLSGFACPLLTGYFVEKGETLENWRYIFFIASGWYIVTCTIFLIFGSSKLQYWADAKPRTISIEPIVSDENATVKY